MSDLFASERRIEQLDRGAVLLRGFALKIGEELLAAIPALAAVSPFRIMKTPGGRAMSAAMTSCGRWGWTSGPGGYAYREVDPETGSAWPAMPDKFAKVSRDAAFEAGFGELAADSCLVNRYGIGTKMGLHQDRDEVNMRQPIVSVSLGRSAIFLWGGARRGDRARRYRLDHGDVLVWGGPSRLQYHGVENPIGADHPITGEFRYNLTFRRAK